MKFQKPLSVLVDERSKLIEELKSSKSIKDKWKIKLEIEKLNREIRKTEFKTRNY